MPVLAWGPRAGGGADGRRTVNLQAAFAELLASALFVIVGCGVACGHGASDGETRVAVALAFGMAILVLAYAVGPHSGGQINGAVTFSLVLGRQLPWHQGVANLLAQLLGSVLGASLLAGLFPCSMDLTGGLGANVVNPDYGKGRALLGEAMGTFVLCFVVWETAVSPASQCGRNACIAIGFAVFLAHLLLLPIDGCSINPTRSFGPAVVGAAKGCGTWTGAGLEDLWVMWLGPLLGAALAAAVKCPFAPRGRPAGEKPREAGVEPEAAAEAAAASEGKGTAADLEAAGAKEMPESETAAKTAAGVALSDISRTVAGASEEVQGGFVNL